MYHHAVRAEDFPKGHQDHSKLKTMQHTKPCDFILYAAYNMHAMPDIKTRFMKFPFKNWNARTAKFLILALPFLVHGRVTLRIPYAFDFKENKKLQTVSLIKIHRNRLINYMTYSGFLNTSVIKK